MGRAPAARGFASFRWQRRGRPPRPRPGRRRSASLASWWSCCRERGGSLSRRHHRGWRRHPAPGRRLAGTRALITTVDAMMPVAAFRSFVADASRLPADAIGLGVTSHVDDEAPLWAELDPQGGRVVRLGGAPSTHVTAGLYVLPA